MRDRIICGDALTVLRGMPDESVHCCVTSPPYWGLRNYGVNGQLGLEATLGEYVQKMIEVFREVRRVLRSDGTLWLNCGDSYAQQGGNLRGENEQGKEMAKGRTCDERGRYPTRVSNQARAANTAVGGLKAKDLCGQPWRLALAFQANGWWLRSDIIWAKTNPMPESITDRPTKSHEYLFLLSKQARYFYDADAIKEDVTGTAHSRGNGVNPKAQQRTPSGWDTSVGQGGHGKFHRSGREKGRIKQNESFSAAVAGLVPSRNKRTVWTIATQPFPEAHFATFPEALVEPCIRAGTSQRGCCAECGAPWVRMVERKAMQVERSEVSPYEGHDTRCSGRMITPPMSSTLGWRPSCDCDAGDPVSAIVLDPFMGSGTTALVAKKLNRDFLGIELSSEYAEMAQRRLQAEMPLFVGEMV